MELGLRARKALVTGASKDIARGGVESYSFGRTASAREIAQTAAFLASNRPACTKGMMSRSTTVGSSR